MQPPLGQTWEWPGTHSVSRGCPCACLCQSPNGKTALPWSPGRTSARLQTPAPQSPRWKHAACCGGREGGEGAGLRCNSTMIYKHIYGSQPSLSRTPNRVISAFTSSLYGPNGRANVPQWIPQIFRDVHLGKTWKRVLLDSTLAQPPLVPVSLLTPQRLLLTLVSIGWQMDLNQSEGSSKSCHFHLVPKSMSPPFPTNNLFRS